MWLLALGKVDKNQLKPVLAKMMPSEDTRRTQCRQVAAAQKLLNEADRCNLPTAATVSLCACARACAHAATNDRLREWSLRVKDNNGIEKITYVNKPTQLVTQANPLRGCHMEIT